MKAELEGQVAVITGAGGFIGSGIAKKLAADGALVVVQDYALQNAEKVVAEIVEKGGKAFAIGGDITDAAQVEKMVAEVLSKTGKVDILVNNAGINSGADGRTTVESFQDDLWNAITAVDLDGTYNCTKHFTQSMVKVGKGRVINISSVAGVVALRKQCAFVAAKSGVLGFTRALAAEMGQYGICVNAIAPGSITNADWRKVAGSAALDSLLSHIPLGRQGYAEDVANAVAFLCDPDSSYISGAMLTVDGGWTCGFMREW